MKRKNGSATEAIIEAHAELNDDLKRLEEAARAGTHQRRGDLAARLSATRAHLGEHFRLEEHGGYMDSVRQREPRLEHRVAQLAEEHQQLMRALDALISRVTAIGSVGSTFGEDVVAWVESVRRHEGREIDLVQEAFTVDISADD
jgi:hypothetical protein